MLCQQCYSREHREALYLLLNNVLSTLFIAKVKDVLARPCRLMKKIIIPKVLDIINLTKREEQMKCPIKNYNASGEIILKKKERKALGKLVRVKTPLRQELDLPERFIVYEGLEQFTPD